MANKKFKLYAQLRKSLQEIDKVTVYGGDNQVDQLSVLCMNISGLPAGDVGMMLDVDHNIAVRTGLQCAPLVHQQLGTDKIKGTVRFSLGPFNTEEHIRAAIAGIKDIASLTG